MCTRRHHMNRAKMTWVTCPTWDFEGPTCTLSSSNCHKLDLDLIRTHSRRGRGRHGTSGPARPRQPVVIHTENTFRRSRRLFAIIGRSPLGTIGRFPCCSEIINSLPLNRTFGDPAWKICRRPLTPRAPGCRATVCPEVRTDFPGVIRKSREN